MANEKKKVKEKSLPVLPRGEGKMVWGNEEKTIVYYTKCTTIYGVYKRMFVSAPTASEAMKLMREREEKEKNNLRTVENYTKTITLGDAMRDWLNMYKREMVNAKSFDRIDSIFTTHILNSDLGRLQEKQITSKDIQLFLNNLKKHQLNGDIIEDKELSFSSKKKIYELLNQYFNNRFIEMPHLNPMRRVVRPRKADSEVLRSNEGLSIWDDSEIEKLTEVGMMKYRIGVEGYKNGPLIVFLMWIFCRVGECQALQWKDIDIDKGTVEITKSYSRSKVRSGPKTGQYVYEITPTKTKNKRTVMMCKTAKEAISRYKEIKSPKNDDEYICDTGDGIMTLSSITRTYEAMVNFAGLPKEKHVTIHGLRHTGISYFLRHGVPVEVVSRLAGHSSIDITQNTYYQILEEQKQKSISELDKYIEENINNGKQKTENGGSDSSPVAENQNV